MNLKQKIAIIIAIIGAVLLFIFNRGLYSNPPSSQSSDTESNQVQNQDPKIVSTKPSPLDQGTILPNQSIEITFNLPIQNTGEFKNTMDPKIDYKIELSSDRKTVIITPDKPFQLGTGYTLFIKPDTKFDGAKNLNRDIQLHFKTIDYKGV